MPPSAKVPLCASKKMGSAPLYIGTTIEFYEGTTAHFLGQTSGHLGLPWCQIPQKEEGEVM